MVNDAGGMPEETPPAPDFSKKRRLPDLLPRLLSAIVLMAAALVSVWRAVVAMLSLAWARLAMATATEHSSDPLLTVTETVPAGLELLVTAAVPIPVVWSASLTTMIPHTLSTAVLKLQVTV